MANKPITCRTPTPGKQPTRIEAWKFNLVREAILKVTPAEGQGIEFCRLAGLVEASLAPDELKRLGSVGWYTTTVKLELEVRGELERLPGAGPQRLRRVIGLENR
jgi:hypothetical protein